MSTIGATRISNHVALANKSFNNNLEEPGPSKQDVWPQWQGVCIMDCVPGQLPQRMD